jgi:hypothetical protein
MGLCPLQSPKEASIFGRLVDVLLPKGGCAMVLTECYFDESIGRARTKRPDGEMFDIPILCVAGYLFEAEAAKRFCEEWQSVLDWKGLPYFHMVDLAHGNGPFADLSKTDRIQVGARMIAAIKRWTIKGFAISVNVDHYNLFMPKKHPLAGAPYSFCAHGIIGAINIWVRQTGFDGRIGYFFEAGHASQKEAGQIMEQLFSIPQMREAARYSAHGFVEKKLSPPVQAADLLAWQFYTDIRRQTEGKTVHRKDFDSLINHPHQVSFVTPKIMTQLAQQWGYDITEAEEVLRENFGPDYFKTGQLSPEMASLWRRST